MNMILKLLMASVALLALSGAVVSQDELTWKRPDGAQLFEQGQKAYEAGDFKAAFDSFKSARKHAKNRQTRTAVDRWLLGTEGANELAALRKQDEKGSVGSAYKVAAEKVSKYLGTPIEKEYRDFVTSLQRKLFKVLEDFERVSGRYSEKYGKKFIDDPERVQEGRRALKWDVNSKNYELKVKDLPRNLNGYKSVSFYLDFPKANGAYNLVLVCPGKSQGQTGTRFQNAFIKQMKPHRGLKRVEVPLKGFNAQGNAALDNVQDLRIQFIGGKRFTCFIDFIALEKR